MLEYRARSERSSTARWTAAAWSAVFDLGVMTLNAFLKMATILDDVRDEDDDADENNGAERRKGMVEWRAGG